MVIILLIQLKPEHQGRNVLGVSEQCFTSPPTQYRLYGRLILQVKRPNQQYQSTEGDATKVKENNEKNYQERLKALDLPTLKFWGHIFETS